MYVIEHALLNLVKNIGRNILLGVIIFAIITTTVIALAIFNTTGVIIENTRTALQCAVTLGPQTQTAGGGQQMIGGSQQEAALALEQYLSFAQSEYLDGADVKEGGRSADGIEATYYLKSPDMLADFETELRSKGLPNNYSVRTDESSLERMVEPVESLKNLSLTFLLIVLTLGAVIILLLSIIAMRERKYEIGVMRAMGMKKNKIALGLWIEILVITCFCFVLGMGAGTKLSQPVSDAIIAGQAQSSVESTTSLADRLDIKNETLEQIDKIDVSIDGITALEIFGISLLLASLAGVISVRRITKSEPIKILMERN